MKSNNDKTSTFLQISVHLTGFSEIDLLGTGMLEIYYSIMMNKNEIATVEAFLSEAAGILKQNKESGKLKDEILQRLIPDSSYNGLAKNIVTMWYMGNWKNEVISPQAYTKGLIWNTASTHPPGAKQPGYGSWSVAPETA